MMQRTILILGLCVSLAALGACGDASSEQWAKSPGMDAKEGGQTELSARGTLGDVPVAADVDDAAETAGSRNRMRLENPLSVR